MELFFNNIQEVESFVKAFLDHSLPKPQWIHKAHFIVGLWYLLHEDLDTTINKLREDIKSYNSSKGVINDDKTGYHETLTVFYLQEIQKFIDKLANKAIRVELFNDIVNSELTDKNYPLRFYSAALVYSPEARLNLVEPDLQ